MLIDGVIIEEGPMNPPHAIAGEKTEEAIRAVFGAGWRVRVRGDAPLDVELPFPIEVDELAAHTPAYTANLPVNAIPYVCAAPAGILRPSDLPPIVPAGPSAV